MKSKKLLAPIIVLCVAVLLIATYALISSIAYKPTVLEEEFPFTITYELDGETVTINDVYRAYYDGNAGYADTKTRCYVGEIGDMGEGNTVYTIKKEGNTRIELYTQFYADYMMGDSEYDYFGDEDLAPQIFYYDAEEQEYGDEETLLAHGVKLIDYEYPTPIENSFVFSHLSYLSGEVVVPTVFIALLALIMMIIIVKRQEELKYKPINIVSVVLNGISAVTYLPFVTLLAVLIDIEGGGPELYYQALYFIPALSILCIALSVALRRNGHGVIALVIQFIGPVLFGIYLLVYTILGLL